MILQEYKRLIVFDPDRFESEQQVKNVKASKKFRINLRSSLGVVDSNYWIQCLNISNVMALHPMGAEELRSNAKSTKEITKDSLLENFVLYVVSAFCVGTEMRFMTQLEKTGNF